MENAAIRAPPPRSATCTPGARGSLAGHRQGTGVAHVVHVVAHQAPVRAILAVPGNRAVHEARILSAERLPPEVETVHDTRPEALQEHVGRSGKPPEDRLPALGL